MFCKCNGFTPMSFGTFHEKVGYHDSRKYIYKVHGPYEV
jgi:hypothetical protein